MSNYTPRPLCRHCGEKPAVPLSARPHLLAWIRKHEPDVLQDTLILHCEECLDRLWLYVTSTPPDRAAALGAEDERQAKLIGLSAEELRALIDTT